MILACIGLIAAGALTFVVAALAGQLDQSNPRVPWNDLRAWIAYRDAYRARRAERADRRQQP